MISLKKTLSAICSSISSMTSSISSITSSLGNVPHYTLLWTNPSTADTFATQIISLDLTDYDAIVVVASVWRADGERTSMFCFEKNVTYQLVTTQTEVFRYRDFSFSNSGVTFGSGTYIPTYGTWKTKTNDRICVPLKIYGIKYGGGAA